MALPACWKEQETSVPVAGYGGEAGETDDRGLARGLSTPVNRSVSQVFFRPTSLYTENDIGQLSGPALGGRNMARPPRSRTAGRSSPGAEKGEQGS